MPKCEGRPNGPCPLKKNDKSVHLSQGDLMLCAACENFRFPALDDNTIGKATHTSTSSSAMEKQPSERRDVVQPSGHIEAAESSAPGPVAAASNPISAQANATYPKIVIDELLTYARYFRDRCTSADLHKLIAHFYLPVEISTSKSRIMNEFQVYLSDSPFITFRRQTTARPAFEAEIDDILGMLELLDNLDVLTLVQFAAASIDRLPRYGPNEINVCSVADKQAQVDQEITEIKGRLT
jgi:hypothetical protein